MTKVEYLIVEKLHYIYSYLLYVVLWLISMTYGMVLWTSARCVVWSLVVVRMAIELKYHNTPYIHIISNVYILTIFYQATLTSE